MVRKPNELIRRPVQKGPTMLPTRALANQWAGLTTLASGSTSQVVSTTAITSDSFVFLGTRVNSVGVGHNSGGNIVVNSIVHGVSFAFARATGSAVAWDEVVMWEIKRPN